MLYSSNELPNYCNEIFFQAFEQNPFPTLILDRNLTVKSANQSYKNFFIRKEDNPTGELRLDKILSHASYEKLAHDNNQLSSVGITKRYPMDVVDRDGIQHASVLELTTINESLDTMLTILSSTLSPTNPVFFTPEPNHWHDAFYQSPVLTFITTPEGIILDANQSFLTTTGLDKSTMQHKFWYELTIDGTSQKHNEIMYQLKSAKFAENIHVLFNFPASTPSERKVLLSARLLHASLESSIIFTVIDLYSIPHLRNDLFHIEQLKIAGALAAIVGHEVRNPMTAVRGFIQMLGRKDKLQEYHSYFELMLGELDRANQIITEYLSIAKTKNDTAATSLNNLDKIIEQLFPLLEITALNEKKSILLQLNANIELYLDSKEICQLILNLVKNGLEAMEAGKILTIKTYHSSANAIMLEIQDQGCGIPESLMDKIGKPFFTTKENGTGLGLSVCYDIAQKNNATITIKSSTEGTTFFVEFTKL